MYKPWITTNQGEDFFSTNEYYKRLWLEVGWCEVGQLESVK